MPSPRRRVVRRRPGARGPRDGHSAVATGAGDRGQVIRGAGPGEPRERRPSRPGPRCEVLERAERAAVLALGDERLDLRRLDPEHVPEPDPDGSVGRDEGAGGAGVDVRRQHGDAAALRLVDERVRRVEAHRLLVEQRREELGTVVHAQPGGLVGEQAERRPVRLREAEAGEARRSSRRSARRAPRPRRPSARPRPRRSAGDGPRARRRSACGSSRGAVPPPRPRRSPRRPSRPRSPGPGR